MSPLGFGKSRNVATIKKFFSQLADVILQLKWSCALKGLLQYRELLAILISQKFAASCILPHPLQANKGKCLCITLPEEHNIM